VTVRNTPPGPAASNVGRPEIDRSEADTLLPEPTDLFQLLLAHDVEPETAEAVMQTYFREDVAPFVRAVHDLQSAHRWLDHEEIPTHDGDGGALTLQDRLKLLTVRVSTGAEPTALEQQAASLMQTVAEAERRIQHAAPPATPPPSPREAERTIEMSAREIQKQAKAAKPRLFGSGRLAMGLAALILAVGLASTWLVSNPHSWASFKVVELGDRWFHRAPADQVVLLPRQNWMKAVLTQSYPADHRQAVDHAWRQFVSTTGHQSLPAGAKESFTTLYYQRHGSPGSDLDAAWTGLVNALQQPPETATADQKQRYQQVSQSITAMVAARQSQVSAPTASEQPASEQPPPSQP
jgi:hypothetical protein